jgi:hypothetical protein
MERLHRAALEPADRPAVAGGVERQEVLGQPRDVLGAFAKRR